MKARIDQLERENEQLRAQAKEGGGEGPSSTLKELMELRLSETMAEAKRHYQSYTDMRDQYNTFVEGRMNQLFQMCQSANSRPDKSPMGSTKGSVAPSPISTMKQQKLHQDLIQTLKVNLEAQHQSMTEEQEQQAKSYEKVSPNAFNH